MNKTKINKNVFHLLTHSLTLAFCLTSILIADQILNTEEKNTISLSRIIEENKTLNLSN